MQEGSTLSGRVSPKQDHFKALLTKHGYERGEEETKRPRQWSQQPEQGRAGQSGVGQEHGRSQLSLRGPRRTRPALK